jgi:PAS domain S-box-containing protein
MDRNGKILIVDDTQETLAYLTKLLKDEGYETFPADSGELALIVLKKNVPDLILLDIRMPGINGFEVCERIKADDTLKHIPVIFLTVASGTSDRVKGLKLGAVDYITKPFEKEELLARIKTRLNIFRLNRELVEKNQEIECLNRGCIEKNKELIESNEQLREIKERLERSEEYQRITLSSIGDAMIATDTEGCITTMNPVAENLTGWKFEEAKGQKLEKIFHIVNALTGEPVENPVDEILKTGLIVGLANHTKLVSKNGKEYHIADSGAPIKNDKGETTGVVLVFRNVTKEYRMREDLKESEERYRSLIDDVVDSSAVGIFILDADFKIVWINRALERYFGLRRETVIGQDKRQLIRELIKDIFEDPDSFAERIYAAYGNNTYIESFECHVLPDDAREERWLEHWSQPIRSGLYAGGRIEHYTDVTDRKRVEDALRESKEQMSDIIEFLPNATFAINRDRRVIIWNKAIEKMTGIPASEMIGKGDYAYTVPFYGKRRPQLMDLVFEDSEEITALYPPIVRQGDTFSVEVFCNALYHNMGAWVFGKAAPLHDASGNIIGAIESIRDITFSKRVEEALQESEEQFRIINESALDAVLLMDDKGRAVYVNPATEKMFGFTKSELIGRDVHSRLMPERYCESFFKGFREFERTGAGPAVGRVLEVFAKRKDGREIPIEIAIAPIPRGDRCWTSAVIRDITERKEAEEALRESEKKYRTILESIEDGYYEVDLAGNFTFFNDSVCRILGYPRDELMGMNNRQFMNEENARKAFETFNHVYVTGKADRAFDWEVITKDGGIRFFEASVSLIRNKEDRPTGFQGICRDITERKQSEGEREKLRSQLMQVQKLESVGQLAGGIAHDFNNLLTTILGNVGLMLMDIPEDDPLREGVEEVKTSGERAAALTKQLLAFSRKQILQPEVMNLNGTIRDMEKMLRRMIRENINVQTVLAPNLGRVEADVGQIEQMIMNLVVNAGDAMPEGGTITIETGNVYLDDTYAKSHIDVTPGDYVMMSVSDTGIGMTEEVRAQVFEPFFTTKEKGKGTGLGLSTVYGIVKQSNGAIKVFSQSGEGATFKVYLPRVDQSALQTESVERSINNLTGTETVLVVEDDEQVRKFAVKSLKGYGYTVLFAANGEEAIDVAGRYSETIHLLLTDVIMPGMNSKDMAEYLKRSRPDVKVLYMSGYTDNAIVHHGVLDPDVAFVNKPFTPGDLGRKVREVLDA